MLSFSVTPLDRYVVTVKVFDGPKLVAEEVLQYRSKGGFMSFELNQRGEGK